MQTTKVTVFKIQFDSRGAENVYELTFSGPPGMQHATALGRQLLEIARCMKRDKFSSNYMLRVPTQIDVPVEAPKPKKTAKKR